MDRPIKLALVMHVERGYCRGIVHGILKYCQAPQNWSTRLFWPRPEAMEEMAAWQAACVIGTLTEKPVVQALRRLGVPMVNVASDGDFDLPLVAADDHEIGRVAADHLLERGLTRLAYVGFKDDARSDRRHEGFTRRLGKAGGALPVHRAGGGSALIAAVGSPRPELCHWLKMLPKPVGIFACDDALGREVAEACRELSLGIPHEIAVLGCDNDELVCKMSVPPLSSIELPLERIGHEAASILDRMLQGEKPPSQPNLSAPGAVVTRASSDTLNIHDPQLAAAVAFIRAHSGEWIGVREVLLSVKMTRRSLERKFRKHLGRTPLQEILRVRLQVAKELLAHTDLSMPLVSRRAGFSDGKHLSTAFRDMTGCTPTEYRRRFRLNR